jgi:hypothetical protein
MIAWMRARRERIARIDAALLALERSAAAAEVERARLGEAVTLSHRALAAMGEALELIARQPARHDALVDAAVRRLARTADDLGRDLARRIDGVGAALLDAVEELRGIADRRIAAELGPVRDAAADHAVWIRAALDRMGQETEALGGARQAAAAVGDLTIAAEETVRAAVDLLAVRADRLGDAAERAVARLDAAAERAEQSAVSVPAPPARKRSPRRLTS